MRLNSFFHGSSKQFFSVIFCSLFIFSCGKKNIESSGKNETVSDSVNKACCEKKPSRFEASESNDSGSNQSDDLKQSSGNKDTESKDGMVWIPGGEFMMGTNDDDAYMPEKPGHPVKVDGFWMDATEVTNAEFQKFVEATGYVTVAEKIPDWNELKKQLPPGTPRPDSKDLVSASLVYIKPKNKVTNTQDVSQWWSWVPGANWKHPEGPGSNIKNRMDHPVVHIAYEDAIAYCKWSDKRLPTEAEWEFAARNCLNQKRYAWGDELRPAGKLMANIWQGVFPNEDKKEDGFEGTAPVKHFPSNCYGLYDMIGNVWEWTNDWYDSQAYMRIPKNQVTSNPKGSDKSYDIEDQYAIKRVVKGGSFLCSENYCVNYRPSARRGQAYDSGTSNIGFRCVK